MRALEKKHPLAIRWFHWVNVVVLFMMLWSGLLIYWANPVYTLRLGSYTAFRFFPEPFFLALGIPYRLAEGMSLHFFFMWLFALNGLLYVGYVLLSGEWRYLVPTSRRSFSEAVRVLLRDLRLSRTARARAGQNVASNRSWNAWPFRNAGSVLGWITY